MRHADQATDRGDDSDPTTTGGAHAGQDREAEVDRTPQHRADGVLEVPQRHRLERADLDDAGHVQGDVDASFVGQDGRDRRLDVVGHRDVAHVRPELGMGRELARQDGRSVRQLGVVAGQRVHGKAPAHQLPAHRQAQAARGTCHQGDRRVAGVHGLSTTLTQPSDFFWKMS